jgi:hypothetical protein
MKEEPLVSSQAIVPGDIDRHLILPEDLIHRGLELAQRLQDPQDISQSKQHPPQEFLVRCNPIKLRITKEEDDGSKTSDLLVGERIDLKVSIHPEGMRFSKIDPKQQLAFTPVWNDSVYAWLKLLGEGEPPIIKNNDYELMYYFYQNQGKSHLELVPSEKLKYSKPIIPGNPRHMKAIGIFLIRDQLPVIFQLTPIDRQGLDDLEDLLTLVYRIKQIKN